MIKPQFLFFTIIIWFLSFSGCGNNLVSLGVENTPLETLGEIQPVSRETETGALTVVESVSPTIFFLEDKGGLYQIAEVGIKNLGSPAPGLIEIETRGKTVKLSLDSLPSGSSRFGIKIPDLEKESSLTLKLLSNDIFQEKLVFQWQPQRHWMIYGVQMSHFDIGYTGTQEEVLEKQRKILDEVINFIEESDDFPEDSKFRWMIESSFTLKDYLEHYPEKEKTLKKYLQDGRIELSGTYMNELTTLNSPEELIRITYASKKLRDVFEIETKTGMIDDIPGYTWALPQVLSGAGVKYFAVGPNLFYRGGNILGATDSPRLYYWEAPDGSRVLFWRSKEAYNEWVFLEGGIINRMDLGYERTFKALPGYLAQYQSEGYPYDAIQILHSKTDNGEPSLDLPNLTQEWNRHWAFPHLVSSTSSRFFEYVEEKYGPDIPVLSGDCPDWWADGVITSAYEEGEVRKLHHSLAGAESFSACASMVSDGYSPPREDLALAYDEMMRFDEHTWGDFTPTSERHQEIWDTRVGWLNDAGEKTRGILDEALGEIASRIKTESNALVVYNPLSVTRTDLVRVSLPANFARSTFGSTSFRIKDPVTREEVPFQILGPGFLYPDAVSVSAGAGMLIFTARNVPSLGYKIFQLVVSNTAPNFSTSLQTDGNTIENSFYRLTVDPARGGIVSIWDKELEKELVDAGAPVAFNQYLYRYQDYSDPNGYMSGATISVVTPGENGPVAGTLVVTAWHPENPGTEVIQQIGLYDQVKRIDLSNLVMNYRNGSGEAHYFAFPLAVADFEIKMEIPGAVMSPYYQQLPGYAKYYAAGNWVDIYSRTEDFGVVWSPVEAPMLEFGEITKKSNMQSSAGSMDPKFLYDPGLYPYNPPYSRIYSEIMNNYQDTNFWLEQSGTAVWNYSISSHPGGWDRPEVINTGWAVNNPLIAKIIKPNPQGTLPGEQSFFSLDQSNVRIVAVKMAEDGDGYIVRLQEILGKDTEVKFSCPVLACLKAQETNLVEENLHKLSVKGNVITVKMKGFGLGTVRIKKCEK